MSNLIVVYLLVALIPICGILAVCMPRLMPSDECFTVTIPQDMADDSRLRALHFHYIVAVSVVVVVATFVAFGFASALLDGAVKEGVFLAAYLSLFLLMFFAAFVLMLLTRCKVKAIKESEGWQVETQLTAVLVTEGVAPKPFPLVWNLLYIPVLLLCAGIVLFLYPSMSDQIPMQVNLSGEVTRSVQKSLVSALFPVWVDLFLVVCFVFSHWSMNRQKPPIDSTKSKTSAYAFGAYRRAMCIMMLVSGLLLCLCIGIAIPLSSAGILTIMQAAIILMVACVVIVVGCVVLALVYGQNGSRLFKNVQASSLISHDDDQYWKAGVFYVNPKDPSLFVSKRFGIGTTINFGNKSAWIVIGGLIVVIVLFVAFLSGI